MWASQSCTSWPSTWPHAFVVLLVVASHGPVPLLPILVIHQLPTLGLPRQPTLPCLMCLVHLQRDAAPSLAPTCHLALNTLSQHQRHRGHSWMSPVSVPSSFGDRFKPTSMGNIFLLGWIRHTCLQLDICKSSFTPFHTTWASKPKTYLNLSTRDYFKIWSPCNTMGPHQSPFSNNAVNPIFTELGTICSGDEWSIGFFEKPILCIATVVGTHEILNRGLSAPCSCKL